MSFAQPVDGGQALPVAQTAAFELSARFAPNGPGVAYDSYEVGKQFEIYIQPFPGSTDGFPVATVAAVLAE